MLVPLATYCSKATCRKVVPAKCHLQRVHLVRESQPIQVLMTGLVRPTAAVLEGEDWVWQIPLDNVAQLGLFGGVHEQNFSGLEDTNLGDRLDVGLTVADLTQDHFSCGEIDEGKANSGGHATRFTDGTDDVLAGHTGGGGGDPGCGPPATGHGG